MHGFDEWHGHFYVKDDAGSGKFEAPVARGDRFGPMVNFRARLPWPEDIAEATIRYPEYASILDEWRGVWDASQPEWQASFAGEPGYIREKGGPLVPEDNSGERNSKLESIRRSLCRNPVGRWIEAAHLMAFYKQEVAGRVTKVEKTDTHLDVLRSAMTVLGFRNLQPGTSVIYVAGKNYVLAAHDEAGNPVFAPLTPRGRFSSESMERAFNDVHNSAFEMPRFWRIAMPYLGGFAIETYGGSEEEDSADDAASSHTYASAVVADMAVQGIEKVTVRETYLGMYRSEARRWDVDIKGCVDPVKASEILTRAIDEPGPWMITVGPHFAGTHSLRMFVHDGRIIGTSPPDRSLPPRIDGHLYDDRVYDLAKGVTVCRPELASRLHVAGGEIVEFLNANGLKDYALDVKVADYVVVIDGVLPLFAAETFAFDVRHLVQSVGKQVEAQIEMVKAISAKVASEFNEYSPLMARFVQEIGSAKMALLIGKKCYEQGRTFNADQVARSIRDCYIELLEIASKSLQGIFPDEEKKRLGMKERGTTNSAATQWMRERPHGYEFVMSAFDWIAESKGFIITSRKSGAAPP